MAVSSSAPWQASAPQPSFPTLTENLAVDVAVIGGGLAGILTAYFLAQDGCDVAVLEAKKVGNGTTALTTAFITQVIDTDLSELVELFGRRKARLVWDSGAKAIDMIETIVQEEKIECDFMRCPLIVYARSPEERLELAKEHKTAARLGFHTVLHANGDLGFEHNGYWEVPRQAKFHPLQFLQGVARKAADAGVQIFEETRVADITGEEILRVKTARGTVTAQQVVVATYQPFHNPWVTFLKKGMYKSYVLQAETTRSRIPEGIYQDMANPYHYLRVDGNSGKRTIIFGGEDHRSELPISAEKSFNALEERLGELLDDDSFTVTRRWTGPILEPSDGLPLIGEYAPGQFVATAFSGNGMTYSVISGLLIADLINGRKTPWGSVYDPKRKLTPYRLFKKALDYIGEFFGGAVKNIVEQ